MHFIMPVSLSEWSVLLAALQPFLLFIYILPFYYIRFIYLAMDKKPLLFFYLSGLKLENVPRGVFNKEEDRSNMLDEGRKLAQDRRMAKSGRMVMLGWTEREIERVTQRNQTRQQLPQLNENSWIRGTSARDWKGELGLCYDYSCSSAWIQMV